MTLERFLLIANMNPALTLIGLMLVLFRFNRKQTYIRLLGALLALSLMASALSLLFRNVFGMSPNYGASLYNFFDLPVIILIFLSATKRKFGATDGVVLALYTCLALYNILFFQKQEINSYTLILKSAIVITYSLNYFYWLLMKLPTTELHRLPMFWINSSWIIFFSGNFFLFAFTSYLVHGLNNDLLLYWTLHNVLSIIETLMIIFALWVDFRNIKSHS
jgi:hypothetical protein